MKKIFSIALISVTATSFAQWNASPAVNNAICTQLNEQTNVSIAADLKGGAILVWEDMRTDPNNLVGDIYAQRISSAGNIMWQTNGVPICTDAAHQGTPSITTDSLGGAIIVWQDRRGANRNLYAQHIDSSGNILWAVNGIGVTLRNYDQQRAKILNDGNKGAIVLWQDSIGGNPNIYGQRLDYNGNALWPGGVPICTSNGAQVNVRAKINAAGDIYVVWQDKRNLSDYDIWAQKLNLSGAPQWTLNGNPVCVIGGAQSNQKISLDGGGGIIIAWQDKRSSVNNYDIYAQRISSAGNPVWATNGNVVCNAANAQTGVEITAQGVSNGAIISWKDYRLGSANTDIYAQMLNLSGARQWAINGIVIANAINNQTSPNEITDGAGGVIISYQDSSSGNWDIKSQRVNAAGTLLWASAGVGVGVAVGDQTNFNLITVNGAYSIYAFQDLRNGLDNDIYAYKLDPSGAPVGIIQLTGNKETAEVYPNPSSGIVTFTIDSKITGKEFVISIYDAMGRKLISEEVKNSSYTLKEKLTAGIYYYTILNQEKSVSGKFVIEN